MSRIDLFTVGFGRPDLLREQKRLLDKHLTDEHTLMLVDNTPEDIGAANMRVTAEAIGVSYIRLISETHEHPEALALAFDIANIDESEYWGCLDHDCFPVQTTSLIDLIDQAGFLGMGQTYAPRHGSPLRYPWPGWLFFSRSWLNSRVPNFFGIRGANKWDDGDAGSLLHSLVSEEDWSRLPAIAHDYGVLREEDGHGLQSHGWESIGDWRHFTNGSHWKTVPAIEERDQLIRDMLAAL